MAELEFILEAPDKGRAVAFPSKSFFIGSSPECQVRFESELLAPKHAEVVCDTRGQWWIRDLVANGLVVVNGRPVLDERLSPGDSLRIGPVVMRVHDTGVDLKSRTVSGDNLPQIRMDLAPDTVISGRYRIIKKLATGGMGEVYRGVHVELGKQLALKVMLPDLSRDEGFVGRFKREAVASSRIGQQNIVDISDFGRTDDGRFFFVMEFVDGKTLKKHLREDGAFPVARVVHVALQAARALAAAHAAGIVHRDLKPENVMLLQRPGQPDFVKVLDFGIAKVTNANTGNYTAIGTVVGTPQYMAPEQAAGLPVDARSDIYSLGLILHELLSGKPTFDADSAVALMAAQISKPPPPVQSPLGPLPGPLERLITQMLEKVPEARPASMEAVIAALEAVASVPTPVGRTPAVDARMASLLSPLPITGLEPALRTDPDAQSVTAQLTPPPATLAAPAQSATEPGAPPTRLVANLKPPAALASQRPAEPGATTATALEALRPNRTPLLVGGLIVLVVGLGVAVALVPGRAPPPPVPVVVAKQPEVEPPTPAPPTVAEVTLVIETEPPAAAVLEDGVLLGSTPFTLKREKGRLVELSFELKGHKTLSRKLRFESDNTVRFELERTGGATTTTTTGSGKPRPPKRVNPYQNEDDLKDAPF